MLIECNTFVNPTGALLHVQNGTNIVFRDNVVRWTVAPTSPLSGKLVVEESARVGVTLGELRVENERRNDGR